MFFPMQLRAHFYHKFVLQRRKMGEKTFNYRRQDKTAEPSFECFIERCKTLLVLYFSSCCLSKKVFF